MKTELLDLQPMLLNRSEETAALAKIIESESKEVEQVRKVVEKDEAAATEAAMGSKAIKVASLQSIYHRVESICYRVESKYYRVKSIYYRV